MASPTRQHANGFLLGARLIGSFLADELRELAGRSTAHASTGRGINHIEEAQVLAGQTIRNPRIAHNRGRFERTVDLSYAPFGNVLYYPPAADNLADNDCYSIPRGLFVAGAVRMQRAGRIDRAVVFITSTVGIREHGRRGVPLAGPDVQIPEAARVSDWPTAEVTLDLRLARAGATLRPAYADDVNALEDLNRGDLNPPDLEENRGENWAAEFRQPAQTLVSDLPVIAGPVRLSTRADELPDSLARPGEVGELPLSISDFAAGDVIVAVLSTPRMAQIFIGPDNAGENGDWLATHCVIAAPVSGLELYRSFEATSIGPAHLSFDISYEAQP